MLKKVMSLVLVAGLLSTMSIGAYAAGTEVKDSNQTNSIAGAVASPTIMMELPTFSAQTLKFDVYNQLEGQQIVSQDLTFTNYSTVPVSVSLTKYQASTNSDTAIVKPATLADVQTGTAKNLFLWVNSASRDADNNTIDTDTVKTGTQFKYAAYDAAADAKNVITAYQKKGDTLADVAITSPTKFPELDRAKVASADLDYSKATDIPAAELGSKNQVTLKFDGAINTNATWASDEVITVTPTFAIVPEVLVTAPKITTTSTIENGVDGTTVTLTGTGFKAATDVTDVAGAFSVNTGDTGLTATKYTATDTTATITFTGTAKAGTLSISALKAAYATAPAKNSSAVSITVAAPVTTASTIAYGATGATVVITGANFATATAAAVTDKFTIDPGTTGLTATTYTASGTTATITFTGTAKAGDLTVKALSAAFTAGNANSNTLKITIVAPPAITLTSTSIRATMLTSSATIIYTSSIAPNATLSASDYVLTSATSTSTARTLTGVTVTVSGSTVTVKATSTAAVAGDTVSFQLKASAFPAGNGDSNVIKTTVS